MADGDLFIEYGDIMRFLKYNGVNLIERTFEEFDTTDYSESQTDSKKINKSEVVSL